MYFCKRDHSYILEALSEWKRHLGWSDNQDLCSYWGLTQALQRNKEGKKWYTLCVALLLAQDRWMCKGWWSPIETDWDLPQGRPILGGKDPLKWLASGPLMGPVQLEEERVFFVLHHPSEKRAVSCTWEPGASAPFQTIHHLRLRCSCYWVSMCSNLILDMFCKDFDNEKMCFYLLKNYQCTRSISVGTGPSLPTGRDVFLQRLTLVCCSRASQLNLF